MVEVMAWYLSGNKPLLELILTHKPSGRCFVEIPNKILLNSVLRGYIKESSCSFLWFILHWGVP